MEKRCCFQLIVLILFVTGFCFSCHKNINQNAEVNICFDSTMNYVCIDSRKNDEFQMISNPEECPKSNELINVSDLKKEFDEQNESGEKMAHLRFAIPSGAICRWIKQGGSCKILYCCWRHDLTKCWIQETNNCVPR